MIVHHRSRLNFHFRRCTQQNACVALTGLVCGLGGGRDSAAANGAAEALTVRSASSPPLSLPSTTHPHIFPLGAAHLCAGSPVHRHRRRIRSQRLRDRQCSCRGGRARHGRGDRCRVARRRRRRALSLRARLPASAPRRELFRLAVFWRSALCPRGSKRSVRRPQFPTPFPFFPPRCPHPCL